VTGPSSASSRPPNEFPEIDTTRAHPARTYDYLLGGTDNFAVDREAIERGSAAHPGGVETARTNARAQRAFLGQAVRYLAGEVGIRQFLDIGTGIPNGDNVHAVAQQVAPDARIVYVDNDPVVLAHAHTLLVSTPEGSTAYVDGDVRHPASILAQAKATLDLTWPVGLILVGILHAIRDEDDPYGIVAALLDPLPAGSHLVISHLASDIRAEEMAEVFGRFNQTLRAPFVLRSHAEVSRLFDGLETLDPGVVPLNQWRPSGKAATADDGTVIPAYGAVARKP
jgi:S-adenosyl methyltransferase